MLLNLPKLSIDRPLPAKLEYLKPILTVLPDELLYFGRNEQYADAMTSERMERFRQAYEEIAQRGDPITISEYIYSVEATVHNPNYRALKNLQLVFETLGSRGTAPFDSGRVTIGEPPPGKPNWELLPPELRYLGPYAERYGHVSSARTEELDAALAKLTDEERQELTELGKRFAPDRNALESWQGEVYKYQFSVRSEEAGHPGEAAGYASQEVSLTTRLKVFLLQGKFLKPRGRSGLTPQQMREIADRMEAEEEKNMQKE